MSSFVTVMQEQLHSVNPRFPMGGFVARCPRTPAYAMMGPPADDLSVNYLNGDSSRLLLHRSPIMFAVKSNGNSTLERVAPNRLCVKTRIRIRRLKCESTFDTCLFVGCLFRTKDGLKKVMIKQKYYMDEDSNLPIGTLWICDRSRWSFDMLQKLVKGLAIIPHN